MSRRILAIAATVMLALACLFATARAQDSLEDRLTGDRIAPIQPGVYVAGDRIGFSLDQLGNEFLLRMDGTPEVFVLYANRTSMGGRVLKYDSGETAILVAGWGAMTLYTDQQPGGLPAVRNGDSIPPQPPQVSLGEMQGAAGDDTQRLAYMKRINVAFSADWNELAGDSGTRSFAFDAMGNAERGLDRFANSQAARDALSRRVGAISIQEGSRPIITLNGRTLVVTFNPGHGWEGRASSRAIARALGQMFLQK
jgi:Domain of unknown function (DUF4908)